MTPSLQRGLQGVLAAVLLLAHGVSHAQDIDLYVGLPPGSSNQPKVLIILDNTANWNQPFTNLKSALVSTVSGLNANFDVGLMLFAETGNPNSNKPGGYVRAAIRTMDATNKPALSALVNNLDILNDKGSNAMWGMAMAEAYGYFAGKNCAASGSQGEAWCVGHGKLKRDHAGNVSGTAADNAVWASSGNAFANANVNVAAGSTYVSPVPQINTCDANYIIFLSNGPPSDNTNLTTQASKILQQAGGSTTTINLSPSGQQGNMADEWARFLASTASGITNQVTTYAVDINPGTTGQGPGTTALLQSMANQGKGKYFAVDDSGGGSQITAALATIFSEIQSVNSVFASTSLPLNAQAQGTFLNQVFVGLFRPQENAMPRWDGNLKQYQFKLVGVGGTQTLVLADANNNNAIGSATNLVTPCARSHWTPTTTDSYWGFALNGTPNNPGSQRPPGQCTAVANSTWSNYPDGNLAERGGAGVKLRAMSVASRDMLTCSGACTGTPSNFADGNGSITAADLGVASGERTGLINWVRGQDLTWSCSAATCGDEDGDSNTSEMRPSAHGAVVHGRPLPVHYPSHGGVVVYYGANDGTLRAINGNKEGGAQIGGRDPGEELWSFIAPEHYGQFKRLRDQSPLLDYPGATSVTPARERKSWFFDGTIGGWMSGSDVWIFPTMRRGGRMVYGFDVSNPAAPSLKWKRGCPENLAQGVSANDSGCDTGFSAIGQTWSEPRIVRVQGYADPVMIVGGGYDPCEDNEPNTCSSPKGNRIYVLNADTGALLHTLNTTRSVSADITVVDANADGDVELAYAVDTGGNLYRIDIGANAPASWTLTTVAALGCDTLPCATHGTLNRKFLHAPEVVVTTAYNALLVGTGDREHPLTGQPATTVENAFFMVIDKPVDATWLAEEGQSIGGNPSRCGNGYGLICLNSLESVLAPEAGAPLPTLPAGLNGKKGWALRFGHLPANAGNAFSDHRGEQVVTSALVVAGVVYFSTHTPLSTTCGLNLGWSRGYAMDFLNMGGALAGGTPFVHFATGGLPPSPVAGIVTVTDSTGNSVNVPFIIGAAQSARGNPIQPALPTVNVAGQRTRVYWYMER